MFPTTIKCTIHDDEAILSNHSFLSANHFTFCHDKSDKKKACHFHSTDYRCFDTNGKITYFTAHFKDFIPDSLSLPQDYNKIFTNHQHRKELLTRIIEYPWTYQDAGARNDNPKAIKRPTTRPNIIRNPAFCNLWQSNNFKTMKAFGVKKGRAYHWTVEFQGPGRQKAGTLQEAFAFITRDGDANDDHEALLQEKLQAILQTRLQTRL